MAQLMHKAAFLGPEASYSHMAAVELFPKYEPQTHPDFAAVESAVADGAANAGVIPIENSTTGRIPAAQALLWEFRPRIVGKVTLPIDHCLIGAVTEEELSMTEGEGYTIRSHPQGFLQSTTYLDEMAPKAVREEAQSTSFGVSYLKEKGTPKDLAIGSRFASSYYGQNIISSPINKQGDNFTSFYGFENVDQAESAATARFCVACVETAEDPVALVARLCKSGLDIVSFFWDDSAGIPPRYFLDFREARGWQLPDDNWETRCASLFEGAKWRWLGGYNDHSVAEG